MAAASGGTARISGSRRSYRRARTSTRKIPTNKGTVVTPSAGIPTWVNTATSFSIIIQRSVRMSFATDRAAPIVFGLILLAASACESSTSDDTAEPADASPRDGSSTGGGGSRGTGGGAGATGTASGGATGTGGSSGAAGGGPAGGSPGPAGPAGTAGSGGSSGSGGSGGLAGRGGSTGSGGSTGGGGMLDAATEGPPRDATPEGALRQFDAN